MSYVEFNTEILSTFSRFYLSDNIYLFTNFFLGIFSTLDILQNFQIRLFTFLWCYFDLVRISFNVMYYFNQRIDRLTHCDYIVIALCYG